MGTKTTAFGVGRRESHDSDAFYGRRLLAVEESRDTTVQASPVADELFVQSATSMDQLAANSVALVVTSPPYHVGKEYDSDASFEEYLDMLEAVFAETYRVLEPGGRAVVNVANLGRRPYVPLSHLVTGRMLKVGFLMRAEIIWRKGKGASGNCAWGSWQSPANPVIRDVHEYCLCFSKGRFGRARKGKATIGRDDFLAATLSVWEFPPESAKQSGIRRPSRSSCRAGSSSSTPTRATSSWTRSWEAARRRLPRSRPAGTGSATRRMPSMPRPRRRGLRRRSGCGTG